MLQLLSTITNRAATPDAAAEPVGNNGLANAAVASSSTAIRTTISRRSDGLRDHAGSKRDFGTNRSDGNGSTLPGRRVKKCTSIGSNTVSAPIQATEFPQVIT